MTGHLRYRSRLHRRTALRLLLLGLILSAYAWRVHNLDKQSLWRDEVDSVYFALRHLPETLAMFVQVGQNGALYFLALRPWLTVAGASEFALRYPSLCCGVLAVPLLWQVARKLMPSTPSLVSPTQLAAPFPDPPSGHSTEEKTQTGNAHTAYSPSDPDRELAQSESDRSWWDATIGSAPLLAALFLAFNPYQLWYSQEGKMYTLVTSLALLTAWLWLRGIDDGGWKPWVAYWAVFTIALYSHLLMILLFVLHFVWFAIAWPQSRHHWRGYGLALAGLTLPYLPFLIWQWDLLLADDKRTGFNFTPVVELLRRVLLDQTRGFMPPDDLIWMAPIFFLGLAGLLIGFVEIQVPAKDSLSQLTSVRRYLLIVSWLFVPLISIYALSLRQPVFTPRYVIWIAPAAAMLLALGIQLLWRNSGALAKTLSTGMLVYVLAFWLYAGWQQKTVTIKYDLRSAVTHIHQQRSPTDDLLILQIPHMEFAYRYYSDNLGSNPFEDSDARLGQWKGGPWTNNGFPDQLAREQVANELQAATLGFDEVWILNSEVEMWDSRRLTTEWLQANGELLSSEDFHGTQVRHYRLNPR
jgi:mannosyltransferase